MREPQPIPNSQFALNKPPRESFGNVQKQSMKEMREKAQPVNQINQSMSSDGYSYHFSGTSAGGFSYS